METTQMIELPQTHEKKRELDINMCSCDARYITCATYMVEEAGIIVGG